MAMLNPFNGLEGTALQYGQISATLSRFRSSRPNAVTTGEVSEWLKEHAWKVCVR